MNWKATVMAIGSFLFSMYHKIKPLISAVVKEVEQAAIDGKITPKERKQIAMRTVLVITEAKGYKLNFLQRFIISKTIDYLAEKYLPSKLRKEDIRVKVPEVVEETAKYIHQQKANNFA